MSSGRITLLVEDLSRLAAALPAGQRYPAIESILARGKPYRLPAETPNHMRFRLFEKEPSGHLPVAALTHVSVTGDLPDAGSYWLRADPVTMRADLTRVFITSCGFSGFDAAERDAIGGIVRDALLRDGVDMGTYRESPWCFHLGKALEFEFTPLHEALGMDVAEALPDNEGARSWKRLMTDIQVDLHQCEVNVNRRANGLPEINSVWFWGGGSLPGRIEGVFDTVVSDDPVSRGLGTVAGVRVCSPADWTPGEGSLLVDWTMESADALEEAAALEKVAEKLLDVGARSDRRLELLDGGGAAWRFDTGARFRFWRRPAPLAETFERVTRQ